MTFDGKNQFIFSHGECIPYYISDVDSVTFTNEEASMLYICRYKGRLSRDNWRF